VAARRRKNWPRWVLLATLVLSVISLFQIVDESGLQLDSAIEIVSCALTAAGLYCYFTGDARGWLHALGILPVIAGARRRREPGISRFSDVRLHIVVRCFASPRNDTARW